MASKYRFQVFYDNKLHDRFEDFGMVEFRACPRIGEDVAGADSQTSFSLHRVTKMSHHTDPESIVRGTILVADIESTDAEKLWKKVAG